MRAKGEYALLWANGKSFGEIFDLMKADIELGEQVKTLEWVRAQKEMPSPKFKQGDRCYYDENGGVVLEQTPSCPLGYKVVWDNGEVTKVWASDLLAGEALDA